MNNILLSVIIPCYNCEHYIEKTLDSLNKSISKDINRNIEIIFVDDGSTDNSLSIAELFFESKDFNTKILKQRNKGVSEARNYGLSVASGKYIFFLDSDDFVEINFFEEILKKINRYNFDVLLFGFNKVNDSKLLWTYNEQYTYNDKVETGENIILKYLKQEIGISLWSMIIKNEIIVNNNIKFRKDCFYAEDIEFFSRVLLNSNSVMTIPKEIFNYYIRNNSAVSSFNEKRFTGITAIYSLKDYVVKLNIKNKIDILNLIDKMIVKEIVYIYFSYIYYSKKSQRNKFNIRKIKNIINTNRYIIKNFKQDSKADESLRLYILALLTAPSFFVNIFLIKKHIKYYIDIRSKR